MPVRIAIIKKTRGDKCWQGCREEGPLVHCWWECKLVQPPIEGPQKIKSKYVPAIPLLGVYPKEIKSLS